MTRSQLNPMPEYFDRYINLTDDVEIAAALQISLQELQQAPVEKWNALGEKVYAPGKWTVKDVLQHLIDTERVFSYRATAFSRCERDVMSFDEELYGKNANANARTIVDLLEEAVCLRQSFIHLYKSFSNGMLLRTGNGFKGPYSVGSIGFIIAGHQRWHLKILQEKYYPLL
jgi:hypothetical protein